MNMNISELPRSATDPLAAGPNLREVIENSLGYQLRMVLGSMRQQADADLVAYGLTSAQWVPLIKLFSGQASSVAELSRTCHLDGGATTRMLDRLEAKGLVRRVRSSVDRRVVNLELTPEGVTAAESILPVLRRVQESHLQGFSAEEWALFRSYLKRAIANGQAMAKGENQP